MKVRVPFVAFMGTEAIKDIEALLDAKEVKRLLKCSLPWVYKAAAQGLLPCVRIPCPGKGARKPKTMLRFKREDILAFIEQYYHGSKTC